MNKKILVILATDFEDTELVSALNIFKRKGLYYDLFSLENKKIVKGQNNTFIKPTIFNNSNLLNYDCLFLPGGKGHLLMLKSELLLNLIKKYHSQNKLLAAICAAPTVLQKAGALEGKKFTSYPGYAKSINNTGSQVEIDHNLVTGKDFESTIIFAKSIAKELKK